MRSTNLGFVFVFALVGFTFLKGAANQTAAAQEATDADARPAEASDEPQPELFIRAAADYLGKLPAASYHLTVNYRMDSPQVNYDMTTKTAVRFQRPNRLATVLEEGTMGSTVVSDGTRLVVYLPMLNRYVISDAPEKLSDASAPPLSLTEAILPIGSFAGGDALFDQLTQGAKAIQYVAEEDLDDTRCHHLRIEREEFNLDVWLESGDEPRLRKIAIDMSDQFADAVGEVAEMLKDAEMEYSLSFSNWNTNPDFGDSDFEFTPPASAEEVESLFEGMAEAEQGPHPLLGTDAPTFATTGLEDNKIDLQSHLGKDIVILDFWATWCGPCVDAMPLISEVAQKFGDRGVVLYAVNVGEDVETIKTFLEGKELVVPVALDPDGEISNLYEAHAIPQTVIIGKDKRVQVVHVGFSPDLGELLTTDLEALLAGEDLATAELAKQEAEVEETDEAEAQQPAQ